MKMESILWFLFMIVGTAIAFSLSQDNNRIIGGSPTTIQHYPFMSNMQQLRYGLLWSQECGGILITSWTILSNAHCFALYHDVLIPSRFWRVRLGSSFTSSKGAIHGVAGFTIHEDYNRPTRLNYDVSIVRLSSPALMSETVGVAQIAGSNYDLPAGTPVIATGWGDIAPGGPSSEQLQHVSLDIINQNLCVQRYADLKSQPGNEDFPDVTHAMVCVGILDVGGRDACQGDSGGPLIHTNIAAGHVIMGITSWGYGCGHPFYPGVSVRVSAVANWIVTNGSV